MLIPFISLVIKEVVSYVDMDFEINRNKDRDMTEITRTLMER